MNILLIEPSYKNKYPPLGLMKISTFHNGLGDDVTFAKGLYPELAKQEWDRIYITTLFTFYWNQTIKTINFYKKSTKDPNNIFVGGVLASLLPDDIEATTGIRPVVGLLNKKGKLGLIDDETVDDMVPDYKIIDHNENPYLKCSYPVNNAHIGYMTRGCVNKCDFCAVRVLEPKYVKYRPLQEQVKEAERIFGPKKDLMLLDNNVLASPEFDRIIDEIKDMGFYKGAKLNNALRHVDFNQGLDARLLTKKKMKRLAEIPLRPMRIAFDNVKLKDTYIQAVKLAAEYGQKQLSNYILFNHTDDAPEDFYERLQINIELNEKLNTQIFSFPMKFSPIFEGNNKDRKHVGKHWNRRYLRGIQCILAATHGVVGPQRKFFETAFGKNAKEFKQIISMPDDYIIYRSKHRDNGAGDWAALYKKLNSDQKKLLVEQLSSYKRGTHIYTDNPLVDALLKHYI